MNKTYLRHFETSFVTSVACEGGSGQFDKEGGTKK